MKKLFYLACALMVLAGCKDNPTEEPPGPTSLKVTGTTANFTGSSQANDVAVAWAAGDVVGVFSPEALSSASNQAASNLGFKADAAGSTSAFSAQSAGLVLADGVTSYNFYAYSPYASGAGSNYEAIPFTLGNQTQSAADNTDHIAKGALMWAKATLSNPTESSTLAANFKQAYAVLRIDVKTGGSAANKLVLKAADDAPNLTCSAGTIDLTDGSLTVTTGSKTVELAVTTPLPASATAQSCYVMVLPGDHTGKEIGLTLTTLGGPVDYKLAGAKFEAGKVYVLEPEDPEVADYFSINVGAIDFSASYIYQVKNAGGDIVAMVTSEYMGIEADKQGVLVYPYADGKFKQDAIFVAKVTKVADEDGVYAAPAEDNLSGGRLSFDKAINTYNYTEGSSAAFSTVYLKVTEDNVVSIVGEGKDATALTTSPYTLTIDSDVYPLVKIGNQLWIAEYLKVKKWNDGTEIPENGTVWNTSNPRYCVSRDNKSLLYSGYALWGLSGVETFPNDIVTPVDKVSPEGWRLPTANAADKSVNDYDTDFGRLYVFLGDNSTDAKFKTKAGGKLKLQDAASGTVGNNITNFSLTAAGRRKNSKTAIENVTDDDFYLPNADDILMWSGTESASNAAYIVKIFRDRDVACQCYGALSRVWGIPARIMKDAE